MIQTSNEDIQVDNRQNIDIWGLWDVILDICPSLTHRDRLVPQDRQRGQRGEREGHLGVDARLELDDEAMLVWLVKQQQQQQQQQQQHQHPFWKSVDVNCGVRFES